jgi:pyridoxine kinase
LDGTQLRSILDGLKENQLLDEIGHVLTGYIGSVSFLRNVIHVIQTIRENNNSVAGRAVRYVCDPVLGDNGKFYVPAELVQVYREEVLPMADVVTPNQFEVEQLTGIKIRSMEDAYTACQKLHDMGPSLVVVTSLVVQDEDSSSGCEGESKKEEPTSIAILASQTTTNSSGEEVNELWRVDSPLLPGAYTGTGDLCASLLLAWTDMEGSNNLPVALEKVIGTMSCIIRRTSDRFVRIEDASSGTTTSPAKQVLARELQLIQSKRDIENAPTLYKARRIR